MSELRKSIELCRLKNGTTHEAAASLKHNNSNDLTKQNKITSLQKYNEVKESHEPRLNEQDSADLSALLGVLLGGMVWWRDGGAYSEVTGDCFPNVAQGADGSVDRRRQASGRRFPHRDALLDLAH